jgi:poly-beta-hydroxybutyrate-responsive repressor
LLLLLHRGDAHGYTLLEKVKEFGFDDVNPTAVYRRLREMEEDGWVTSSWDTEDTQGPPRRVYRLTATGDAALAQWVDDLHASNQRIAQFLEAYETHMEEGEGAHH